MFFSCSALVQNEVERKISLERKYLSCQAGYQNKGADKSSFPSPFGEFLQHLFGRKFSQHYLYVGSFTSKHDFIFSWHHFSQTVVALMRWDSGRFAAFSVPELYKLMDKYFFCLPRKRIALVTTGSNATEDLPSLPNPIHLERDTCYIWH